MQLRIVLLFGLAVLGLVMVLVPSGAAQELPTPTPCNEPSGRVRFDTFNWPNTDFCKHSVPYEEIRSGGPPPDGIPPIDSPVFESVVEASRWLEGQSPVIALVIDGDARAYPLSILTWHEIANDVVGNVPVAITFCPLCNSSIVFDRRVDGQTLRLGVSGNLRNSDMIMWDSQTQSWWQQLTGEGIVGFYTGTQLTMLPSQVVGFAEFAANFPEGKVLSRQTGHDRSYGTNPYTLYDSSERPFLFEGEIDPRLPATEHVLAGLVGGEAIAYPYRLLATQNVINDTVGNEPVVAIWQSGATSALDQTSIDASRDVGMAMLFSRDLDGQTLTFQRDADGVLRDEQTKSAWNVFGLATDGPLKGKQLLRQIAGPHFWFAWAAFRPETRIYGQ